MATSRPRRQSTTALLVIMAYLIPLLFVSTVQASATACSSVAFTCISEGGSTLLYAGNNSSAYDKRGVRGALSATSTALTNPSGNGFAHWFGIVDHTPPGGYGVSVEWMQAGIANGIFNGNGGYTQDSNYHWYSEAISWCNGYSWVGAGSYTPDNTYEIETSMPDASYDCGSGGATYVYRSDTYLAGSLAISRWLLTYGSQYRADANTEYRPYDWMNPVGRVCFGSAGASSSCIYSSYTVDRLQSATWSNWGSSGTTIVQGNGYNRNNQTTNFRFNVTSTY